VDEPGNVSPLAEANFLNDPHAADAVFAADWPATVVGLDVTHRIMIGDSHLARLRDEAGATGDLIWHSSRFYIDFYTQKGAAAAATENGSEPACAMHDAAAIAAVVIPDAFTTVAGPARVVAEGMATGQFAIDRAGYQYAMPHWQGRPDTLACMAVDAVRVRDDFLNTLVTHRRV
jgi:inosine-uridine nucleoside N-ribohydrolase